jgi:hypothetical protein
MWRPNYSREIWGAGEDGVVRVAPSRVSLAPTGVVLQLSTLWEQGLPAKKPARPPQMPELSRHQPNSLINTR